MLSCLSDSNNYMQLRWTFNLIHVCSVGPILVKKSGPQVGGTTGGQAHNVSHQPLDDGPQILVPSRSIHAIGPVQAFWDFERNIDSIRDKQTSYRTFWMNKEQFTRAGLEPATSGLTCRYSTNWNSPILAVSVFCQYLCSGGGGGGRQSEVMKPYTAPWITPKLRYNLGRGSKGIHQQI